MQKFDIYGAGLAGLIAANIIPNSLVWEKADKWRRQEHKAVLRLRRPLDDLGIECKKATVRKGIWYDGMYVRPNITLANMYSRKVGVGYVDRSIWNTAEGERYIPPRDLQARLENRIERGRITFLHEAGAKELLEKENPKISTIPMPAMVKMVEDYMPKALQTEIPLFIASPIYTLRFAIPDADLHQTVYFPQLDNPVYRASVVENVLIVESIRELTPTTIPKELFDAFFLFESELELIDYGVQNFGKIAPLPDETWRRAFIGWLSDEFNIFSLGRFATWRPDVMIHDIIKDVQVIKALAGNPYERRVHYEKILH